MAKFSFFLMLVGTTILAKSSFISISNAQSCATAQEPKVVSYNQFREKPFGTLALSYTNSRVALIDTATCYDVATFVQQKELQILVNNRGTNNETHYISATALRSFDYKILGTESLVSASYWRNGNKPEVPGKWASIDEENQIQEGGIVNEANFVGFYESQLNTEINTPNELKNYVSLDGNKPYSAKWHAWILQSLNQTENDNYTLLQDTRLNVGTMLFNNTNIEKPNIESILSRFYLVKFASAETPTFPKVLTIGVKGPPRCIYLGYGIDGKIGPVLDAGTLTTHIVFRIDHSAEC